MISPGFTRLSLVSALKTRILLGHRLGQEGARIIIRAIEELGEISVLLVDLTEADVLDYNFCAEAIGPLIKAFAEGKYTKKNVVVKVEPDEKEDVLEGIIRYVKQKTPVSDAEAAFEQEGLSIKLLNQDHQKLEFIGPLTDRQTQILELINEKGTGIANEVAEALKMSVEDVVDDLKTLKRWYFVFAEEPASSGSRDEIYWSFYQFLKGEEDASRRT